MQISRLNLIAGDLLATIQIRFQAQQPAGLLCYLRNIIHGAEIGCKLLTSKPYITILHDLVMIDSRESGSVVVFAISNDFAMINII